MAERQIAVPTAGIVAAKPTFRIVASMNPRTTWAPSGSLPWCTTGSTGWPSATRTRRPNAASLPCGRRCRDWLRSCTTRLVADAAAVTRATREHPDIRQGSSVRGAIDLTLVARQLLELRGPVAEEYPELVHDAMVVALSEPIFLDETVDPTPEAALRQIWEDQFILAPAAAAPG
jgi:MoxR-like ATPase